MAARLVLRNCPQPMAVHSLALFGTMLYTLLVI